MCCSHMCAALHISKLQLSYSLLIGHAFCRCVPVQSRTCQVRHLLRDVQTGRVVAEEPGTGLMHAALVVDVIVAVLFVAKHRNTSPNAISCVRMIYKFHQTADRTIAMSGPCFFTPEFSCSTVCFFACICFLFRLLHDYSSQATPAFGLSPRICVFFIVCFQPLSPASSPPSRAGHQMGLGAQQVEAADRGRQTGVQRKEAGPTTKARRLGESCFQIDPSVASRIE